MQKWRFTRRAVMAAAMLAGVSGASGAARAAVYDLSVGLYALEGPVSTSVPLSFTLQVTYPESTLIGVLDYTFYSSTYLGAFASEADYRRGVIGSSANSRIYSERTYAPDGDPYAPDFFPPTQTTTLASLDVSTSELLGVISGPSMVLGPRFFRIEGLLSVSLPDGYSLVAVPGPIAGAGFPVLASLLGFAWWRRRAS